MWCFDSDGSVSQARVVPMARRLARGTEGLMPAVGDNIVQDFQTAYGFVYYGG
jgi:hypothetical protein